MQTICQRRTFSVPGTTVVTQMENPMDPGATPKILTKDGSIVMYPSAKLMVCAVFHGFKFIAFSQYCYHKYDISTFHYSR